MNSMEIKMSDIKCEYYKFEDVSTYDTEGDDTGIGIKIATPYAKVSVKAADSCESNTPASDTYMENPYENTVKVPELDLNTNFAFSNAEKSKEDLVSKKPEGSCTKSKTRKITKTTIRSAETKSRTKCPICHKVFEGFGFYRKHKVQCKERQESEKEAQNGQCPICLKKYIRERHFSDHILTCKKKEKQRSSDDKIRFTIKCPICDKVYHHTAFYESHVKRCEQLQAPEMSVRPNSVVMECPLCTKAYIHEPNYFTHLKKCLKTQRKQEKKQKDTTEIDSGEIKSSSSALEQTIRTVNTIDRIPENETINDIKIEGPFLRKLWTEETSEQIRQQKPISENGLEDNFLDIIVKKENTPSREFESQTRNSALGDVKGEPDCCKEENVENLLSEEINSEDPFFETVNAEHLETEGQIKVPYLENQQIVLTSPQLKCLECCETFEHIELLENHFRLQLCQNSKKGESDDRDSDGDGGIDMFAFNRPCANLKEYKCRLCGRIIKGRGQLRQHKKVCKKQKQANVKKSGKPCK